MSESARFREDLIQPVDYGLAVLVELMRAAICERIERKYPLARDEASLFPPYYALKWGLNNLYKCDLALGWRLTYTLSSDGAGIRVDVLEIMPHPEYDKRFRY